MVVNEGDPAAKAELEVIRVPRRLMASGTLQSPEDRAAAQLASGSTLDPDFVRNVVYVALEDGDEAGE